MSILGITSSSNGPPTAWLAVVLGVMTTKEDDVRYYLFASPNTSDKSVLNSIEKLDEVCEGFFSVVLSSKNELEILLRLLGLESFNEEALPDSKDFSTVIDISTLELPEFDQEEFDEFYELWLSETGRASDMDEYGQLIFIRGQASKWNQRISKVVLSERS